eukprot:1151449-Pelagomonas_calceolata.AAC.3
MAVTALSMLHAGFPLLPKHSTIQALVDHTVRPRTSMVKMAVTALSRLCTALPREELGSRLKVSKLSRTHEQMTTPMIKASNQRWEVTWAHNGTDSIGVQAQDLKAQQDAQAEDSTGTAVTKALKRSSGR